MKLPELIAQRICRQYGLDESMMSGPGYETAVRQRMRAHGISDVSAYFAQFDQLPREFDDFVDELLVPESWFFRDRAPFEYLELWVKSIWQKAHSGKTLRILSVPCAAGPEPYSIAMTLLDAGLKGSDFQVYAGDISERTVDLARKGEFRKMAFRGKDAEGRLHHFEPLPEGGYRVCDSVKQYVRFQRCNLLELDSLSLAASFDVIFCRNVFIYFRHEARQRAIGHLKQLLSPDGVLFVGHADGLPMLSQMFETYGPPGAFCYRHREEKPVDSPAARPARRRSSRIVNLPRPVVKKPVRAAIPKAADLTGENRPLREAVELADKGELDAARELCRTYLEEHSPTAEALFLLGQIEMASSRMRDGEAYIRKALYLDPRHREALLQLAILAERRGANDEAARLRSRVSKQEAADA